MGRSVRCSKWAGLAAPVFGLLAAAALGGCSAEGSPAPSPKASSAPETATNERGLRLHLDPVARVRFPLPAGLSVDARHFDASLPEHKIKHMVRIGTPVGPLVTVDVWTNPKGLALVPWFDAHLTFLIDDTTGRSDRPMTRGRLPGILLSQPRSPQALARATAIFASGDQVFRVTCMDAEQPFAREVFDRIVAELEPGVTQ